MATPTLAVVSGPAGSGKTTLAHTLAAAIGCPAICRDEIKEGMVHAFGARYEAALGDDLTRRATLVFFAVLRSLLESGASLVAEAAFQDHVWRPHLEPLTGLARIRVIRCQVDPDLGRRRVMGRPRRMAHDDASVLADAAYYRRFVPIALPLPTLDVDTSDGYAPGLERVLSFLGAD